MSWTRTKSSSRGPRPAQPNNMVKDEFIALVRGLLRPPSEVISWRCLTAAPGSDASAIHGRLGAQVALLQSPILPAAGSLYPEKELLRNLPVDKPHTSISWFQLLVPWSGCDGSARGKGMDKGCWNTGRSCCRSDAWVGPDRGRGSGLNIQHPKSNNEPRTVEAWKATHSHPQASGRRIQYRGYTGGIQGVSHHKAC